MWDMWDRCIGKEMDKVDEHIDGCCPMIVDRRHSHITASPCLGLVLMKGNLSTRTQKMLHASMPGGYSAHIQVLKQSIRATARGLARLVNPFENYHWFTSLQTKMVPQHGWFKVLGGSIARSEFVGTVYLSTSRSFPEHEQMKAAQVLMNLSATWHNERS